MNHSKHQIYSEVWTRVWSRNFTKEENRTDVIREKESVRWRKISALIRNHFHSFSNLRTIEIGSGRGIYSLLASLEGAHASLLDNNERALERAKEFFDEWGQNFHGIAADAFACPTDLLGKFDIAMSHGLAEHFWYPERFEIFRFHLRLLKPGGILIVSVPNRSFLPYRVGKFLLEVLNKWELGLEIPFSRGELEKIAKQLGLSNWQIIGSGVVGDTLNFWLTQRLIHLPRFLAENIFRNLAGKQVEPPVPLKNRSRHFSFDPSTGLDDYWGYALILVGETR